MVIEFIESQRLLRSIANCFSLTDCPLHINTGIYKTMNISDILKDPSAMWDREAPASSESIRKLVADSPIELPEEYLALLLCSNGGEGELAVEPGWFQLWSAEKVV